MHKAPEEALSLTQYTTDQSYPLVTDHPQTVLSIEIVG